MMSLYQQACNNCSRDVTKAYSTSFYSAIKLLHKDLRAPIHNIYGFVRLADEIVDTFHNYDKKSLLHHFSLDTWKAIYDGISTNPILQSFQQVVADYNIPPELVKSFLHSMELDLYKTDYNNNELEEYIYGSAEAVGLMCLCVFCEGNAQLYTELKHSAQKLGAAFQKVNFLRDINADMHTLNRTYMPGFIANDAEQQRITIEQGIEEDFKEALAGIRLLSLKARLGVYTAYKYYYALFRKIKRTRAQKIMVQRVRVPDYQKLFILMRAKIKVSFFTI